MSNNYKDQYGKNTVKIIHKGKVVSQSDMKVQLGGGDVIDKPAETNVTIMDDDNRGLMHINHQAIAVGESVAQIKRSTTAKVTSRGTVIVSQVKSEISSRGEDVYFYDNSLGTFEGTLEDAKKLFPNVDFSDLQVPDPVDRSNPEFANIKIVSKDEFIKWKKLSSYDAEDHGGKPTTWGKWADSFQTALDIAGLVPGLGEIADCVNGCISLARGNYGDAALSFAAMVPFAGAGATVAKIAKKAKKAIDKAKNNRGVYDLIIKNTDNLDQAYVGQSNDIYKRLSQHFGKGKAAKLKDFKSVVHGVTHKMAGSTKLEREIYEQFILIEKYGGIIKEKSIFKKLLNKVNPVGGRFDLNSVEGLKKFKKRAKEIAENYNLPTEYKPAILN